MPCDGTSSALPIASADDSSEMFSRAAMSMVACIASGNFSPTMLV